ncbi:MAG: biopolymer transporter ExbD [Gemmatimonadetes bacterium]|nr:biopolymer transporter ExbD [Gemmatimonadota bacterium]MDE2725992.1 biopolymer transporter ExbD [Gemmatimonadota bacterium]MDE2800932.1 biopolymer transporter ExbD [Gemmatimonadota bacterium]MXX12395.1 biopolymer transporter ExbD [Gemmatimonadota bacterium]MXZ09846.1 biopolymer transporter ExbD [Gemmatimonadota bacterium]
MNFKKKGGVSHSIPTGSMADITFLLLIFFMVSTVFVRYRVTGIIMPKAEKIEELKKRRHINYLWVSADRKIYIDDKLANLDQIAGIFYDRRVKDPRMVVSLKCDYRAPYGLISSVMEELRKADALRINFATNREG